MGERIAGDVAIGVQAALKPNRIAFRIPTQSSVVVPEVVVVKPGLLVEVLPREPSGIFEDSQATRILIGRVDAERLLLLPLPFQVVVRVVDGARRVEILRVVESKDAMPTVTSQEATSCTSHRNQRYCWDYCSP